SSPGKSRPDRSATVIPRSGRRRSSGITRIRGSSRSSVADVHDGCPCRPHGTRLPLALAGRRRPATTPAPSDPNGPGESFRDLRPVRDSPWAGHATERAVGTGDAGTARPAIPSPVRPEPVRGEQPTATMIQGADAMARGKHFLRSLQSLLRRERLDRLDAAKRGSRQRPPSRRHHPCLCAELLEDRLTPAVTFHQSGATLQVTLGAAGDAATIAGTSTAGSVTLFRARANTKTFKGLTAITAQNGGTFAGQSITFTSTGTNQISLTGAVSSTGIQSVIFSTSTPLVAGSLTVSNAGALAVTGAVTTAGGAV